MIAVAAAVLVVLFVCGVFSVIEAKLGAEIEAAAPGLETES